jgi:hypothetical protein
MQCSYFKMTMVTNSEAIIKCVSFVNLIIWLWIKFNFFFPSSSISF